MRDDGAVDPLAPYDLPPGQEHPPLLLRALAIVVTAPLAFVAFLWWLVSHSMLEDDDGTRIAFGETLVAVGLPAFALFASVIAALRAWRVAGRGPEVTLVAALVVAAVLALVAAAFGADALDLEMHLEGDH